MIPGNKQTIPIEQFISLLKQAMAISIDGSPLLHDWKITEDSAGITRLRADEYSVYGTNLHSINLSDADRVEFYPLKHLYKIVMKKSGSYDIQLYTVTSITLEEER